MITFRCDCGRRLKAKDEQVGRKIKCPECDEIVRVPDAGAIQDEETASRLRNKAPREDDDRPRRKSKQSESNSGLLIGGIAGGTVLLIGIGLCSYFLFFDKRPDTVAQVKNPEPTPVKQEKDREGKNLALEAMGRRPLQNSLKQVTLAMHNYNDAFRRLPAQGFSQNPQSTNSKPLLSWRVAILPYIEQDTLYRQFKLDEPWDGPNNKKLIPLMPKVYEAVAGQKAKEGCTYLQLVTGPGTLYPTPISAPAIPRSFLDGTSNTVMIVEAAEPVPWTKPADFTIDVSNVMQGTVPKLGALSPRGFYVGMADGSTRFINRSQVRDVTIRQAFNPADGMPFGTDW